VDLQTPLNIAAAIATVAGLGYGIWQQRRANRLAVSERDMAAARAERLKAARTGVYWAAESVDSMIQRSKEPHATVGTLADHARAVRAQLRLLDIQLLEALGQKAQPLTRAEAQDLPPQPAYGASAGQVPPAIAPLNQPSAMGPSTAPSQGDRPPMSAGAYFPPRQPPPGSMPLS
jgi:hypothetical protein